MRSRSGSEPLIPILQDLITRGEVDKARQELQKIHPSRVRRNLRAPLARLSRRAGLPHLALALLHPILRGPQITDPPATPAETCEYAMALTRLGALEEADLTLSAVGEQMPEAIFCRTAILFCQWRQEEAIPLLEKYAATPSLADYDRDVGRVNLGAAYLEAHRAEDAEACLSPLIESLRRRRRGLLLGNVLELMALSAIQQSRWKAAEERLFEAQRLLQHRSTLDRFFLEKMRVLLALRQGEKGAANQLAKFRARAIARRHWESVRGADRWAAVCLDDTDAFARVLFGTPHGAFRERLLKEWKGPPPDSTYLHGLRDGDAANAGPYIDVQWGRCAGREIVAPGQLSHRLLRALTADLYRPADLAALFQRCFPDDFYHPVRSPPRIHQAVSRLRTDLRSARIDVEILKAEGGFLLSARSPVSLRLTLNESMGQLDWVVERLRQVLGTGPFTSTEAAQALGTPARTLRRKLDSLVRDGLLGRSGTGSATRYQLAGQPDRVSPHRHRIRKVS